MAKNGVRGVGSPIEAVELAKSGVAKKAKERGNKASKSLEARSLEVEIAQADAICRVQVVDEYRSAFEKNSDKLKANNGKRLADMSKKWDRLDDWLIDYLR